MIFRIPRGKHRARPLRFGFWWRKTSFDWVVKFTESCRYDLQNDDQLDTNKLCGIGYLPGHHKDSARFGWRYDAVSGRIEIMAYCYVDGARIIESICFCEIGNEYHLMLNAGTFHYHLHVYERYSSTRLGIETIEYSHKKKFKYRLGIYFGGNKVAPHEIKIELKML